MAAANKMHHPQEAQHDGPVTRFASFAGLTPMVPGNTPSAEGVRLRPTDEQVRAAPGMVRELESETTYREDFGKRVPEPSAIAAAVARARALSDESARAEAWHAHLKNETQIAWQQALELTNKLQEQFEVADAADPGVALRFPETKAFYEVRARIAERAVASRKRNRTAKKNTP